MSVPAERNAQGERNGAGEIGFTGHGGLNRRAQQVAPHMSAEVGLYLPKVRKSTVETIAKVNQILANVKARKDHKMIIRAIPEEVPTGMYAAVGVSNQNMLAGSSAQGIPIGLGPQSMEKGVMEKKSSPGISNKIGWLCRSPGLPNVSGRLRVSCSVPME